MDGESNPAQEREKSIFRWVVGTWMGLAILFGVLNLVGVLNVR